MADTPGLKTTTREQMTAQKSGLTAEQHLVLWRPWEPGAASPAEVRQLVRLGLIERVSANYFVTAEGKRVREMAHEV